MSNYIRAAALALVLGGLVGCGERQAKRLPGSAFRVAFESHDVEPVMSLGERSFADVRVKNMSSVTWPSKPNPDKRYAVNLAYHWLNDKNQIVVFDGERTALPKDLEPGESVTLKAAISPPDRAGAYTLEITLVQEAVAWFPERGGAKLSIPVKVVASPREVLNSKADASSSADVQTERQSNRPGLPRPGTRASTKNASDRLREGIPGTGAKSKTKNAAWSVQVGAFPEEKAAEHLAQELREKGYDVSIVVRIVKGLSWHQVRVGRMASRAEAKKLQQTLIAKERLRRSFIAR